MTERWVCWCGSSYKRYDTWHAKKHRAWHKRHEDGDFLPEGSRKEETRSWTCMYSLTLFRDKHRCRACETTENLEVHHIISKRKGGTGHMANLVTLCHRCHSRTIPVAVSNPAHPDQQKITEVMTA